MDIDYNPVLIVAVVILSIGAIIVVSKHFKLCCFDTIIVPLRLTAEERWRAPSARVVRPPGPTIQGISINDEPIDEIESTREYPPPPYQQ